MALGRRHNQALFLNHQVVNIKFTDLNSLQEYHLYIERRVKIDLFIYLFLKISFTVLVVSHHKRYETIALKSLPSFNGSQFHWATERS